jgi:hypothetical protein
VRGSILSGRLEPGGQRPRDNINPRTTERN